MGEVLCSTENSPFLIIDHIHAKINRVCCAALAIGKRCMNVRKNKLLCNKCDNRLPVIFFFYYGYTPITIFTAVRSKIQIELGFIFSYLSHKL